MTHALTGWTLEGIDWVALGAAWVIASVVAAPIIGVFLHRARQITARRRDEQIPRPELEDTARVGYRPPRD